ncbi:unnamed protein product [Calicophoron daubneyi]|uniref:Anion exchange protein n=1 Tax=Calicophoron daubneyi TaxID=300641 RepID=A0AAV2TYY3_CALDB
MTDKAKFDDEPVVDTGRRYCIGEPSQEEIEDHRSQPAILVGLPSSEGGLTLQATGVLEDVNSSSPCTHHQRRRRRRLAASDSNEASKSTPANPSEHIMFLLGADGDEETHHLFCEMDELFHDTTGSGETEWREAARWVKFEEIVEENGERWSKPHVATLPLFSLFELRSNLANGVLMLNMEAFTMEQITDLVLNVLVSEAKIPEDSRDKVADIMLRRHVHLHERLRPRLTGRSATNLPIIRSLADIGKRHSSKDVEKDMASQPALAKTPTYTGVDHLDPALATHIAAHAQAHGGGSSEVISGSLQGKYDLHFFKKISPDSETANILIGETSFLPAPFTVFIRLKDAVLFDELTEVPVPTRFIFIHLGTAGNAAKYREIGRSMGVLMSDEIFHDVAYKSKSRVDLLAGLDEFLSAATVLPPGEWDPSIRIEPPASVPSQKIRESEIIHAAAQQHDSRKSGTATTPSTPLPESALVAEQLHGAGDKLTVPSAVPGVTAPVDHQSQDRMWTGTTSPTDSSSKSKKEVKKECGSLEAGGGPPEVEEYSLETDPALQRTGRLFGGLIMDIKRRAPHYLSDFTDALHPQCIASFIFLYFACLTPIITFGGLLSQATGGYLGTIESICSGAVVGVLYALFSGQPLTIMGSTGPVLIFEGIIYRLCQRVKWDYLSFRFWIGTWCALFLFVGIAFDLSALVKFITRFTEESFATLIALIFIVEALQKMLAVSKVYRINLSWSPSRVVAHNCTCIPPSNGTDSDIMTHIYYEHPLLEVPVLDKNMTSISVTGADVEFDYYRSMRIDWNTISEKRYSWDSLKIREACVDLNGTWSGVGCEPFYVPDVFFFSCLLFVFTFFLAISLKGMRSSQFFPSWVRSIIADFSVVIAISLMTLVDFLLHLHTPKLMVPADFEPTLGYSRRGWIIPPFNGNPWWTSLVAIGPSLLAVILIFMDQQITAVIVNRPENKLKKGAGYHLDLLIVALTVQINSIIGIPWFVAATVLAINHVLSLKKESEVSAPGERPVYLGCREQRVTGVLIFSFIGLSVFMTRLLGLIPMAVLYGIFLFMGMSSLNGIQMFQRIGLMFMPVKYQPDYPYLRHVALRRIHLYTVIQVGCLAMLWVIKSVEAVSILFPIMVLAMCFIRWGLDYVFTQEELSWLDEVLPGSHPKKRRGNVFRVTSSAEVCKDAKALSTSNTALEQLSPSSEEKPINITEEVSKTTIWRQLSGADIKERPDNHQSYDNIVRGAAS